MEALRMDCLKSPRQRGYEDLDKPQPDIPPLPLPSVVQSQPKNPNSTNDENTEAVTPRSSRVILKANGRRPQSTPPPSPFGVLGTPPPNDETSIYGSPVGNRDSNGHPVQPLRSSRSGTPSAASRKTTPPISFLLLPDAIGGGSDVSGESSPSVMPTPKGEAAQQQRPATADAAAVVVVPRRKKTDGLTNNATGANRSAASARRSRNGEDILRTEDLLQNGKNVLCPICMGIGKIPKEEEKHRVALIAADDERLKPSRTLHYVAAAVALTVIVACLMMFFLYPRSFTISQKIGKDYCGPKLYPYNLTIDTADNIVDLKVTNYWELKNPNFYPIQLVSLNVQAYHDKLLTETSNCTSVPVSLQSTRKIFMDLEITIQGDLGYLVKFCADKRSWVHNILIRTQVTAVVNVMGYNFTSITETYQKVSCGFDDISTTKPSIYRQTKSPKKSIS